MNRRQIILIVIGLIVLAALAGFIMRGDNGVNVIITNDESDQAGDDSDDIGILPLPDRPSRAPLQGDRGGTPGFGLREPSESLKPVVRQAPAAPPGADTVP